MNAISYRNLHFPSSIIQHAVWLYDHGSRTHLSLGKYTPSGRTIQPIDAGKIVVFPQVGGLHHRYERLAA